MPVPPLGSICHQAHKYLLQKPKTLLHSHVQNVRWVIPRRLFYQRIPCFVEVGEGLLPPTHTFLCSISWQAFRRLRKTDNNRIARAVGATVVSRPDEIQESDIGTGCGLFEVRKIGDE